MLSYLFLLYFGNLHSNGYIFSFQLFFKASSDNHFAFLYFIPFHAKMGTIKERNGMDLTEAEDIKKRWQEYTQELYKKDFHHPDIHDGVVTHLEPDILECEVKWVLGSITTNQASGSDGILVELFQILKDYAVKVLHSICQQIWITQQWPQVWNRLVFIQSKRKARPKYAQTTTQLHSFHMLAR